MFGHLGVLFACIMSYVAWFTNLYTVVCWVGLGILFWCLFVFVDFVMFFYLV